VAVLHARGLGGVEAVAVVGDRELQAFLAGGVPDVHGAGVRVGVGVGQRLSDDARDERDRVRPRLAVPAHPHRHAGAFRGALDRAAQACRRLGREHLQARADEPVRGLDRLAQALHVGLGQRELAACDRQVLRKAVVDLGGERAPFALDRRGLHFAPQPGGGDASAQLRAEEADHRPAQRVDGDRLGGARDHHALDERQDHPVRRGRVERVRDEPAGRFPEHDRRTGREPPRLLVEGELLGRLIADVAAQHGLAVGVGQVEHRAIEPERLAHLLERRAGEHGQLAGPDERPRNARDRGEATQDLGGETVGETFLDHGAILRACG
jgi:hypothetical protein